MIAPAEQSQPIPDMGICKHGNFTPCPLCVTEAGPQKPEKAEKKEAWEERMEIEKIETPLFEGAFATTAAESHAERNEDALGVYSEENTIVVYDGMGGMGAGDVASQTARDAFVGRLKEAQTMVQHTLKPEELAARWEGVVKSNALVPEEEAGTKTKLAEIRDQEIRKAQEQLEALNLPNAVKQEAVAISDALKEVSSDVQTAGKAAKEQAQMQTTAVGVKIMKVDGRNFGVFFSVGDSEAHLERTRTGAIVQATKSDSPLDYALEAEMITETMAANLDNPAIRDARFKGCLQGLGQKEELVPRVMVWELEPGDRIQLSSDGLGDQDLKERWKETLRGRKDEPWEEVAPQLIRGAMEGAKNPEEKSKKGGDDITVATLEIKEPEWAADWDRLLEEEIAAEGLVGEGADEIKIELNKRRGDIAREALNIAEAQRIKNPELVTKRLREAVQRHLDAIRRETGRRAA